MEVYPANTRKVIPTVLILLNDPAIALHFAKGEGGGHYFEPKVKKIRCTQIPVISNVKMMDILSSEATLLFCLQSRKGSTLKGKNLLL